MKQGGFMSTTMILLSAAAVMFVLALLMYNKSEENEYTKIVKVVKDVESDTRSIVNRLSKLEDVSTIGDRAFAEILNRITDRLDAIEFKSQIPEKPTKDSVTRVEANVIGRDTVKISVDKPIQVEIINRQPTEIINRQPTPLIQRAGIKPKKKEKK